MTRKRIGVFSGTFDPIHNGHVEFIKAAIEQLDLQEVILLVEAKPRRKTTVATYDDRLAMSRLALKEIPEAHVDAIAPQRKGEKHTVKKTLQAVKEYVGDSAEIWLLMGGDVFEHVPKWEDAAQMIDSVKFFVGLRTEDDGEIVVNLNKGALKDADVTMAASTQPHVSSSKIRLAIHAGRQPLGLNPGVQKYIEENQLYG